VRRRLDVYHLVGLDVKALNRVRRPDPHREGNVTSSRLPDLPSAVVTVAPVAKPSSTTRTCLLVRSGGSADSR
jgi:hypothetical protein